jgi:long-chain fatty acid transport protein
MEGITNMLGKISTPLFLKKLSINQTELFFTHDLKLTSYKTNFLKLKVVLSIICFLGCSSIAYATNGYILHGYGKNKGTGGAGMANPQDALAAGSNPAGSAWVGDRIDITGELFMPKRGYTIEAPGNSGGSIGNIDLQSAADAFGAIGHEYSITSEKDIFMIPAMGFVKQLPHGSAVGLAIYGAGLGTEYSRDDTPNATIGGQDLGVNGTFLDGSTGIDLLLIMANLHFATKVTDDVSVGFGIVGAAQSFKAKGLSLFQPVSNGKIKNNERDWTFGAGFTTGVQWNVRDDFSVAASYYSKIKLTHDKYTGLFADEGDFSLAPMINVGMTYKPNRTSAISFDIQWIQYSEIDSVGNKFDSFLRDPTPENPLPLNLLGDKDGPGFGFEDSIVYKMGYQFKVASLPKYTWRVGFAYQDQIIPENATMFPMLAPATITEHYTMGMTRDFGQDLELNINFLYAAKDEVKGTGFSEGIDIYLEEYGLEFGVGYKY